MMAMGADLKSSLTFLPNEHLYTSQYLGNLGNYDVYDRFVHEACNLMSLFNADPEVLLVDKHPAYVSSAYGKELAKSLSSSVYSIQHHKAHFASVLGEHELFDSQDKILGVIWDGTGYGDDSQIWGGEFFEYHNRQIERLTHFEYFDWIAGDKMSKEPRLSLFSLCEEETDLTDKFTVEEINIYTSLKKNNRLKTSSVGRLFDAVASLLGLCDYNTYEGEASILLENLIGAYDIQQCKSYVSRTFDGFLPSHEIIKEIKRDIENNTSNSTIAINFIYTLAKIIIDYASSHNYRVVCCSGGVFQNTTLIDMLQDLNNHQMRLCFNRKLPPNDENISFGQAMYYLYCKEL